jgi:glycosyltransferase involved in cell wall biosynthesis
MQSDVDVEIIAIDDNSTDDSASILASLSAADSRIRAYYNDVNMGVAAVRNKALLLAKGDYIAFCDSDDTVPDGAYKAMMDALNGEDFIIGAHADKSDSGQIRFAYLGKTERTTPFRALFAVSCLWTKLIRRELVMKNGLTFDEDMTIGEDVVFLARLSTLNPTFTVIDEVIYNHIHHSRASTASLTHIYSLSAFESHLECRKRLISICESAGNSQAREYVYENFSGYLDRFITFIGNGEEREAAFCAYRDYMKEYCWKSKPLLFRALFGVEYDSFLSVGADGYIQLKYDVLPRDTVADEFAAGRIGLRWIFKYFKNWLKYKLKRSGI